MEPHIYYIKERIIQFLHEEDSGNSTSDCRPANQGDGASRSRFFLNTLRHHHLIDKCSSHRFPRTYISIQVVVVCIPSGIAVENTRITTNLPIRVGAVESVFQLSLVSVRVVGTARQTAAKKKTHNETDVLVDAANQRSQSMNSKIETGTYMSMYGEMVSETGGKVWRPP